MKEKFSFCIIEDRYSLLPVFLVIVFAKLRLVSRLSDWGEIYVDSLDLNDKLSKYLVNLLDNIYRRFVLRYSYAIIVPSEYVYELVEEKFEGHILNFPYPHSPNILDQSKNAHEIIIRDKHHDIYCALVGNFNYPPNEDSANFIIKELAPEIKNVDSKIKFLLVGSGSIEKFSKYNCENIISLGLIDNLYELYKQCQIGINPSKTLGGTSIKNVEYLTSGLFVISTQEAAVGVIASPHMFVETRAEFLNLILNLSMKIRTNEITPDKQEVERIKKYYSKTVIQKNTLRFFDDLLEGLE